MSAPIVIAGAGIGGLTAALSLAAVGKSALLFERVSEIEEVGAGLQIAPNAGRVLARLGLDDQLAEIGLEPQTINIRQGHTGEIIARLDLSHACRRWGAPFRVFHRADLQQVLLRAARANPAIEIRTNANVEAYERTADGVVVTLTDATGLKRLSAAGLIGADGLRSAVRAQFSSTIDDAPIYAGSAAWRALLPARNIAPEFRLSESNLWLLPGGHIVHYPLRDGSIINVVAIFDDQPGEMEVVRGVEMDSGALMRRLEFCGAAQSLRQLIANGQRWRHWPFYSRPQLNVWSIGPITLLGDAAHPMLPFLAQGAAQAIEDADALGQSFADNSSSVEEAFLFYQQRRMRRANAVVTASRRQGRYFHMSGAMATARNLAIRALGGAGMLARNAWLYR